MLKKQHEKDEGMDKLSRKQKSKIRSKAMVSSFKKKRCIGIFVCVVIQRRD